MQLFCYFVSDPKTYKEIKESKEKNEKKKKEKLNPELKSDINNNHKYVSKFLFGTFKLIEKVRNIFLFDYFYFIVK